MPRSERLKLKDVRAVYRLVGECRELGDDSLTWQRHLLAELAKLIGGQVGIGGCEAGLRSPYEAFAPFEHTSTGWGCAADERLWLRFMQEYPHKTDSVFQLGGPKDGPTVQTWRREQVVSSRVWYASAFFNDYMRKANIDLGIVSWYILDKATTHAISIHPAIGAKKFTRRECRMVGLLHRETGRLIGGALAGHAQPGSSDLPPRIREALECLLEGDSEKRVARRMGLSPLTVHEYVKAIYTHFGVSSRAELLALFLRRFRGPRQNDIH